MRGLCKRLCAAALGAVMVLGSSGLAVSAAPGDRDEIEGTVTVVIEGTPAPPMTEPTAPTETTQTTQIQAGEENTVTTTNPLDEADSILEYLDVNNSSNTLDLVILITILSIAPSLLIMLTCFTRLIISFSLLRNAMGLQGTPPNQVLVGLALFLTLFIMNPVITEMNDVAYVPYKNGEYTTIEAVQAASKPLKVWMLKNTGNESMAFMINLTDTAEELESANDEEFIEKVPFTTVVPAFILSELKTGFQIGFLLYVPFLVIDIVVSSTLMSMGMMMLPPATVSMPFKLMLFVLADGWTMLLGSLVTGFNA